MKKGKFFFIYAVIFSILTLGMAVYASSLDGHLLLLKAIYLYIIVCGVALTWAIAAFYGIASAMISEVTNKYNNIERILLDMRDGTKYFFSEKRRSLRAEDDMPASFTDKTSGDDYLKVKDISLEGARVRTTHSLKSGETVKLNIYLPSFSQPIYVKARVSRFSSTSETMGTSAIFEAIIEFTEISNEDKQKLLETINSLHNLPHKNKIS